MTGTERVRDGRFVEHAAARHVEDDRAGLELGDRVASDEPARRPRERDVDGHDIGAPQHLVEAHEFDTVVGCGFGRYERIDAEHGHLHRPGTDRDGLSDLAEADDPDRPAAQFETGELGSLPLAAAERCVGLGDPAGDAVEQRQRVLGGGDGVAGRGVDDDDPRPRRGIEVDVVDTDPGPPDDGQPRPRGDQFGVDLDAAADDQGVIVRDDRAQLIARQPGTFIDLVIGPKEVDPFAGDRLSDEDPHAPAPAAAGVTIPYTSSAATWAAATAAPCRTERPAAIDAISRELIAPMISSTVTEPRWPSRKILPVSLPWPPARTRPRLLRSPLNDFQSRSSGTLAAVTVFEAWRGSANSSNPSAVRPARVAAAQASCRAKIACAPSALISLRPSSTR